MRPLQEETCATSTTLPLLAAEALEDANGHTTKRQQQRRAIVLSITPIFLLLTAIVVFLVANNSLPSKQQQSLRHPLSFPKPNFATASSRRVLTLGGPSTLGHGLEDPERQAYPYLLSSNVHNEAIQSSSSATLASLCTQSIVGDTQVYDTIVLEFPTNDKAALLSLNLLAQRLRRRFPLAEIILVNLWNPSQNQTQLVSEQDTTTTTTELQSMVQRHGAKLYQLPLPNQLSSPSDMEYLFTERHLDEQVTYTLSPDGQRVVANGILSLLEEPSPRQDATLGDWGDGDSCQLWYDTGVDIPETSDNVILKEYSDNHKYALEIDSTTEGGGSITIENPFETDRMVYLTYMTASLNGHANKVYPRTKVQMVGQQQPIMIVLDPYHEQQDQSNHHLARTSAIGKIPPGRTTLTLGPMEHTKTAFRLVGTSLLSTAKVTHQIPTEFELLPEAAMVVVS